MMTEQTPAMVEPLEVGGVSKRFLRHFKTQVEDWYDACKNLSSWEEQELIDNPSTEGLATHSQILDDLERVGHWLAKSSSSTDFPDSAVVSLINMTLQDLKDRRGLWHGSVSSEKREEILKSIFNEP